jgi:hypothetical protein
MRSETKTVQVVEEPKIHWGVPQLFKSKRSPLVVLSFKETNPEHFSGQVLVGTNNHEVGFFSETWDKASFELLVRSQQVILQND